MSILALRVAALTAFLSTAFTAEPQPRHPLAGEWEGSWEYTTGMSGHVGTFRLVFVQRGKKLTGQFIPLEIRHMRIEQMPASSEEFRWSTEVEKLEGTATKIRRLVHTSVNPCEYRWEADGYCWNIRLKGDEIAGFRNGGECNASGLGGAARLVAVEAKRKASHETESR